MAGSSLSLARRERLELCDLALVVGEDAPTLSGDWDAKDLVAHLLVRERRPLSSAGIILPALSGLHERALERYRSEDFGVLVEKLRSPGLTPYAIPGVEEVANTLEYFVHHEDLRRAQRGWQPRQLDAEDEDRLWRNLAGTGRMIARKAPVPLVIRRTDTGRTATLKGGTDAVVVSGPVGELAMFVFGRSEVRDLEYDGPADRIAALREASLGI